MFDPIHFLDIQRRVYVLWIKVILRIVTNFVLSIVAIFNAAVTRGFERRLTALHKFILVSIVLLRGTGEVILEMLC